MPLSHKIGAILALVPFFIGAFFGWVTHNQGYDDQVTTIVMGWWLTALVVYAAVRFVSFVITGRL